MQTLKIHVLRWYAYSPAPFAPALTETQQTPVPPAAKSLYDALDEYSAWVTGAYLNSPDTFKNYISSVSFRNPYAPSNFDFQGSTS
mmetsp:Transcript_35265/g.94432  ORF Transcript_35265/g.94432 Transcript_35265/m.94432 type:complete len:86 (+) Transcript_35265:1141-1398(+)